MVRLCQLKSRLVRTEIPRLSSSLLLVVVFSAPFEAASDDALDDPVVGGRGGADAEVDLPVWADVEIDGGKQLLLLNMQTGDLRDAAIIGVVFETAGDLLGEVVTDFDGRRKVQAQIDVGAMPGALQSGVDGEVPSPFGLIENGANLPGPGVAREERALIASPWRGLHRKASATSPERERGGGCGRRPTARPGRSARW